MRVIVNVNIRCLSADVLCSEFKSNFMVRKLDRQLRRRYSVVGLEFTARMRQRTFLTEKPEVVVSCELTCSLPVARHPVLGEIYVANFNSNSLLLGGTVSLTSTKSVLTMFQ